MDKTTGFGCLVFGGAALGNHRYSLRIGKQGSRQLIVCLAALSLVAADKTSAPLEKIGQNGAAFPLQADPALVHEATMVLDLDGAAALGVGGPGLIDLHLSDNPNGTSLMKLGTSLELRRVASDALRSFQAFPLQGGISDFALVGTDIFCKPPRMRRGFVGWHQDQSWWLVKPEIVTIWVALDDSTTNSACVRYLLGSHKDGKVLDHTSHVEDNMLKWSIDVGEEDAEKAVCAVLQSTEFAVFSGFAVHSSPANEGPMRRCGVAFRYTPWPSQLADSYELNGKPYVPVPVRLKFPTGASSEL